MYFYSSLRDMGKVIDIDTDSNTNTKVPEFGQCFLQVDVVVGTPGRLEDLISTGRLALHQCRFFVLDEAVSSTAL